MIRFNHIFFAAGILFLSCFYACSQPASDTLFLAKVKLEGKYGYIDRVGNQVVPCIYDAIYDYSEGFAEVRKDGKYGFINTAGELVIPCEYDYIEPENPLLQSPTCAGFSEGLVIVSKNGKYGYINTKGEIIIPIVFDSASDFHCSRALVSKNGTKGFIDKSGDMVIVFDESIDEASDFSNGLALISKVSKDYGEYGMREYGKRFDFAYGAININGEEFVNFPIGQYDPVAGLLVEDTQPIWVRIKKYDGKYGYFIIKASEGGQMVAKVSDIYDGYSPASKDGFCVVEKDDKYGVIDVNGKSIIPCSYDDIPFEGEDSQLFHDGLLRIEKNGKFGFVDKNRKLVVAPKYKDAGNYSDGMVRVYEDGNWGYLDTKGQLLLNCVYSEASDFSEGLAVVEVDDDDDWIRVINTKGDIVFIPGDYKIEGGFSGGLALVSKRYLGEDKYGYINTKGEEVIPCVYDYPAESFSQKR